jgi:hypothetical protein
MSAKLALSLTVLLVAKVASAKPAEAKRVVVGQSITPAHKFKKHHDRMWEEVEAAARDGSWTLVKVENNVGRCSVKDCPQEYAEREKTNSVISIEGLYTKTGYNITVKIWSKFGKNGQSGWVGEFAGDCDLCSGFELTESVGINVRKALVAEAERLLAVPEEPPPVEHPETTKPPLLVQSAPVTKPARSDHEGHWAPWLVMGAGAVATGLGIGLWSVNGNQGGGCWKNTCGKVYDTRAIGIGTTVIGIAAILAGGGWYLYQWRSSSANVAIGPGTIHLAGRF